MPCRFHLQGTDLSFRCGPKEMKMQSVRVFCIVTLTTLSSWAATTAQAQNAIKVFGATPITRSAPCEGPFGCDPVHDRMVFDEAWLALSCKGQPRAILSSTADGRGGLVADNFIEVNGDNVCGGSCFNFPVFESVGTPALDAYQPVPPIDVSRLLRPGARSTVSFSLVDVGGIYANSDVWLVTNCTATRKVDICHKPGTRAEHVITVSQAAVSGHLGHGDTLDLSACQRSQRPVR
jgi:hypothetical protein